MSGRQLLLGCCAGGEIAASPGGRRRDRKAEMKLEGRGHGHGQMKREWMAKTSSLVHRDRTTIFSQFRSRRFVSICSM
jgi:hypothetical protein